MPRANFWHNALTITVQGTVQHGCRPLWGTYHSEHDDAHMGESQRGLGFWNLIIAYIRARPDREATIGYLL
jgi:hypothetical protein